MEQITFEALPKAFMSLFLKIENIERLLQAKIEKSPDTDELLTIQQAAELLKLSVPTIYGLVSKAQLPVNKRGKRLYFSKDELTNWVKGGRKKTIAELQDAAQQHITEKKR